MTSSPRSPKSLSEQTAELSVAVPQVIARRLVQMTLASPVLNRASSREFDRMTTEKAEAFVESWHEMTLYMLRLQQSWVFDWCQIWFTPWQQPRADHPLPWSPEGWFDAGLHMLEAGMEPVHRRATRNARRLGRTPWLPWA